MKAIIPVAGIKSRLKPHTNTQPKALLPVAGKPILSFIIDRLINVDCEEFIFIIGDFGDKIKDYVTQEYPDLKTHFVFQGSRKGIGHAVWKGKEYINNDEDIIILLGDTIVDADLKSMLDDDYSTLGIKQVDDPTRFGVAEIDDNDFIQKVVEKPKIPTSNKALVGLYHIRETGALFEALQQVMERDIDPMEEYQLTDAIQLMIDQNIDFKGFPIDNWHDCGNKEVLLETNSFLLQKKEFMTKNIPIFENTVIIDPVSIADDCQISNAIVGPNVSLGKGAQISDSIIKESIIGQTTTINSAILNRSVIGSETYIKGISQSLNIGDSTEIDFS